MLKVGLTGGMGTGKSTASDIFRKLGAFIFDADKEAKLLLDTSKSIQNELITEFGTDILTGENKIDRGKLARISFQDEEHQFILNSIIHPHIFEKIDESFEKVFLQQKSKGNRKNENNKTTRNHKAIRSTIKKHKTRILKSIKTQKVIHNKNI